MFIHPRTDARATASKARLKWHIISRHATTSLAVTSAVHRNRKNDRIRLNYVFHLAPGGFRRRDREGKRRKTHRGFSTNETFGVYLSRRADPPCFVPRERVCTAAGEDGKGRAVEEERFVFITRAVASSNGSVGGCSGYGGRGVR